MIRHGRKRPTAGGIVAGLALGVLLAVLSAALPGRPAAAADPGTVPLRLVTGNDYRPYTDESLPEGGMHTEIVRRAFERQGQPVEIAFLPWKRGLRITRTGEADATFSYSKTAERQADFAYSEPFFRIENRAFVRAGSDLTAASPAQFAGRTLCSPMGYANPGWVGAMVERGEIEKVAPPAMTNCFRMLQAGRIDIVRATIEQGRGTAAEVFGDPAGYRILPGILYATGNHLIVSRRHPHAKTILATFNRGLAELRETGMLDGIVERHRAAFYGQ